MSRHATRLVACVAALLAFVSPVGAHADYEQPLVNVVTPDGRPLLLVKRFTDGIIGNDPVKLVLYDARTSTVVAETDYYRDIRTGGGDIYYCYEATSLACERVVRFTPEGQWVDEPPGSYAAASVLAYYAGHWVMHGVVAMGYPLGKWGVGARKPVHEVAARNSWQGDLGFTVPEPLWPG